MDDNNKKLIELVEQAACSITMIDGQDLKEIDQLQKIISKVDETIAGMDGQSEKLIKKAKGSTSRAVKQLEKILKKQSKDVDKSIEDISKSVLDIQGFVKQLEQDAEEQMDAESQQEKNDKSVQEQSAEEQSGQTVLAEDDIPLILDFVGESEEHLESAEAGLLELESKPGDKDVLNTIFRSFHTIKGMAGFLNLEEIGSLAHSAENLLDLLRKGQMVPDGDNIDVIFESIDFLKKMIGSLKQAAENGGAVSRQPNLDQLLERLKIVASGEKASKPTENKSAQPEQKSETADKQPAKNSNQEETKVKAAADEKIRISTTRLDDLINMAGELVIAQLMVSEEANNNLTEEHELLRKVANQSKIVRELQELSMSMRMVPIGGVFQKMARVVRDLSHKTNKKVNFTTRGDETELDRNIVDKIADPLIHMVRNSVDHGIESPEQRKEKGKDPTGNVELRAFHQAGNIVIEIEDDGKGLDKERILNKAIENGIVEPGQELSDEEIYKLVFHAGLSTAKQVTNVSGRGVGMDVVKKNIEALRGKVDITSAPGKGSTFTIRLPLTLAIIDGQIVRIGGDRFIIPINSIVRTVRPKASELSSVQERGEMVNVRNKLLPLVRLYKLFNIEPKNVDPTEALIVIVEEGDRECGLLVDELLGQQQVVIKSLGQGLEKVNGISGGAIMGDGKVSLIVDVPGLMELAQG